MSDQSATETPKWTANPTTFSRSAKLLATACVPVIVLLVYYAPSLTSLGWHLIHGSVVRYHGLRIEVPLGWTADVGASSDDFPGNPQGITLQKPPKTLRLEAGGPELVYINVLTADEQSTPQQQMTEWQSLFRESHAENEFEVTKPNDVPPSVECLEATPLANKRGVALACISLSQEWLANFAGSRTNVPLFLNVLAGLKRGK